MLLLSFALLLLTALLGTVLATLHLQAGRMRPLRWPVWGLHGLLGLAGFILLLLSLGGPPRGAAMGLANFGLFSAVLLAVALLAGLEMLFERLRYHRLPILVVGLHATLAIGAVIILAAYTMMG
ncbi:MAG TPA: hypothetical protein VMU81_22335 [Acetobacteraceae bacterium]|nr:hypothetical protein [Acetobacteraceae bacterium]